MKTYMELAVGKRESGGVYICKDQYLMDKFTSYSKKQLAANANALAELQKKLAAEGISMQTILVPMAAQVLTDKLPAYAPVADYAAILQVLTDAGMDTVDIIQILSAPLYKETGLSRQEAAPLSFLVFGFPAQFSRPKAFSGQTRKTILPTI